MFNFPQTTRVNKRVPKDAFYTHAVVSELLKRAFVEQIKSITWLYKFSKETVNVAPGQTVTEIEVFEIKLKTETLDEGVLRVIDKSIPYHILYLLEYEGKYQVWLAYKSLTHAKETSFKVNHYYHTAWLERDELPLSLTGLNLDLVLEQFFYQIAGEQLTPRVDETLDVVVARREKRKSLEKQIQTLRTKIRNEKQLNIQMTLNAKVKALEKELSAL